MVIEFVFWGSLTFLIYAYFGYPCALMALSLFRDRPVTRDRTTLRVSLIIAAYNEGARIGDKIENTLRQDYPAGAFEIIVASDCSTDRTDEIVRSYAGRVRLVRSPERRGKEAAQQFALEEASGEVLIFSDVATSLAPDAVSTIMRNFADETVGCVSSVDRYVDADGTTSGEGAYVRYEMFLRGLESRVNSLVGLSGSFFAVRREVCRRWAADRQSDFNTLLNTIEMGLRGVLDSQSVGYYRNVADDRREFQRKIRTVTRGIAVLTANTRMLNPLRYGLFAWQLASHKLCRWLVPFAMIAAAISNAWLFSRGGIYQAAFLMQLGFYTAALVGLLVRSPLLKIPAFLFLANFGVLTAWLHYLRGDRFTVWTPSERRALPHVGSR